VAGLVVHGHSLALGAGASAPERGFARLVADGLGLEEHNLAVGGAIAHWEPRGDVGEGGWPAVRESPALPARDGDVVLLFYGINDLAVLGRKLGPYEEALRKIVAHARTGDAPVLVLTQFPLPNYDHWPGWPGTPLDDRDVTDALNPLTRSVAREAGAHVVELEDAFPDGYVVDHSIYPDDAGHARIAELVLASARAANIGGCPPSPN
jgi:lysophospholipase L1-like esterase